MLSSEAEALSNSSGCNLSNKGMPQVVSAVTFHDPTIDRTTISADTPVPTSQEVTKLITDY